jgi:hypothetical protein
MQERNATFHLPWPVFRKSRGRQFFDREAIWARRHGINKKSASRLTMRSDPGVGSAISDASLSARAGAAETRIVSVLKLKRIVEA